MSASVVLTILIGLAAAVMLYKLVGPRRCQDCGAPLSPREAIDPIPLCWRCW